MVPDRLSWLLRDLFVNRINPNGFVVFEYDMTANVGFDVAEAALRSLLILTRRSIHGVTRAGEKLDINTVGGIQSSSALNGSRAHVKIAIPKRFFQYDDPLTTILMLSSSVSEYGYCKDVWLSDIEIPDDLLAGLTGPRYGVHGIRERLNVYGRPLLAAIIPPSMGSGHQEVKRYVSDALDGGVDLVADDILRVSSPADAADRIATIQEVVRFINDNRTRAQAKVGYLANCSVGGRARDTILSACRENGVFGLIANAYTMSYDWISSIARNGVSNGYHPVIATTNMGSSMLGRHPLEEEGVGGSTLSRDIVRTGVSEVVTAKLSRLAGADAVHTGTTAAECWHPAEFNMTPRTLSDTLGDIRQAMCVAEGDLRVSEIGSNVRYLGEDTIIEVSSGMLAATQSVKQNAAAYSALCMLVSPRMTDAEYEALLIALDRKNKTFSTLLDGERWKPNIPATTDPIPILREAQWMDHRRREYLNL